MKIAQIPQAYLPSVGGIQSYVYRLSRDLVDGGDIVDVLTSDLDINQPISEKQGEVHVKYFHPVFTVMRNPFVFGLIPHLMRHSYDIIHIHSLWAFSSIISALFKRRAKLITTAHGVTLDSQNRLLNIACTCYKPFVKFICKRSDKIVVLGRKDRLKVIELFGVNPNKIEVIPNGIEIETASKKAIHRLMQKYSLENYKIILFTGRVSAIKNPHIMIEALSLVKNEGDNVKLMIVGPITDKYKKTLNGIAQRYDVADKVVFTGEIDRQEVIAAYNIADIFVSLGIWEGLPTTMLEAMSHGVPCIMFNSGGVEDVIIDGENGLIVNELNAAEVNWKIILLLSNNELYKSLSTKGKALVASNYNWKIIMEKIKKVYNAVVDERCDGK